MHSQPHTITSLLGAVLLSFASAFADPVCIDFEEYPVGANLPMGSKTESKRVGISIDAGLDGQGQPIPGASAAIIQFPQGSGNRALLLSNAKVCFDFACASQITLQWTNAGGFVAFTVNGDTIQLAGLQPGSHTVGGATVVITGTQGGTITVNPGGSNIMGFCIAGSELIIDNICHTPCPENPDCLDFEGLDSVLSPGDSFLEDGIEITAIPFQGNNGSLGIGINNLAKHYGQELAMFNAGIAFSRHCVSSAKFDVFQGAPGVEVSINGESILVNDIKDLNGITLGGVDLSFTYHKNAFSGIVTLVGQFGDFSISGSELFIDHFCAKPCARDCIDFEEELLGTVFDGGDSFYEDNIELFIGKYGPAPSPGTAVITDQRRANHLGQELHLKEVSLVLNDAPCIQTARFHFAQSSPGIELIINGDKRLIPSMAGLDGLTVGGATIEVFHEPVSFGIRGIVTLTGQIDDLSIGGVDLHLDHICLTFCPSPNCIDFEIFPWLSTYTEGDELVEDGLLMTVHKLIPLPAAPAPLVTITSDHAANHFGHEARLKDARLDIEFPCATSVTFRAFQHSSGFGLRINNIASSGNNLDELDGTTVAGSLINVSDGGNGSKIIQITGDIVKLGIGGTDMSIDHICHVPCSPPATFTLGRLYVFQGVPECLELPAAGPGELALRVEVTGSPTLTLFSSPDLGQTLPWAPVPGATFVPVCSQPGLRQVIVPMTTHRMFYRVGASE